MRKFGALTVAILGLMLAGCASQHAVVASTPRSIEIRGTAWNAEDNQKAFSLAQAECAKHGRHAALVKDGGSKPNAWWNFDCVN